MNAPLRHFLANAIAGALALFGAVTAVASADNSAVAINTKDNSFVFRLAFSIVRISGDVVAPTNIAFAYSSCTACQTVAIAVQVVLVTSDPQVAAPTNVAVAYNYLCDTCDTLAVAYQFFDTVGGKFMITPEGRQEIARIRRELESLRHSNDLEYIRAQAKILTAELQQVLTTQIVPVGDRKAEEKVSSESSPTPTASPSPEPSPSPSLSPLPPQSPSPSPS